MLYYYIFKNDYEHKLNNFKMSLELRSLSAERLKKPTATQRAQENKKKRASCAAAGAGEPNDSGRRPQRAPRLAAILRDAAVLDARLRASRRSLARRLQALSAHLLV